MGDCYDIDLFEKSNQLEQFICPIGKGIFKNPTATPCDSGMHVFCNSCITTWLNVSNKCPLCSSFFDTTYRAPIIKNLMDDLIMKCPKCDWKGKYGNLQDHIKVCLYEMIKCPNKQCKYTTLRKDLDKHKEECLFESIKCHLCSQLVIRKELTFHIAVICPVIDITCEYCKNNIKRGDIENHHNQCDGMIIHCENKNCEYKCKRNLMKEHSDQCIHRKIKCVQCEASIIFSTLEDHIKNTCPKTPKNCEHCDIEIISKDLVEHYKICQMKKIDCEFFHFGCLTKYNRMNKENHMKDSIDYHLNLLTKYKEESLNSYIFFLDISCQYKIIHDGILLTISSDESEKNDYINVLTFNSEIPIIFDFLVYDFVIKKYVRRTHIECSDGINKSIYVSNNNENLQLFINDIMKIKITNIRTSFIDL